MNAAITTLSSRDCQLGEGPIYDPVQDTLYWFDILRQELLCHSFATGSTKVEKLPFMASAMALVSDQEHMLFCDHGLYLRHIHSGALRLYLRLEADNPITRSNDARVHPCGAFWLGTMGRNLEPGAGSIYWLFKGELKVLFEAITCPNSICFAPDGTVAYFTDSMENILYHVRCDPRSGLPIEEPRVFFDNRNLGGALDGSVVASDGTLWNARWGCNSLDAYSPEGERIRSIELPAKQLTCPAFIGNRIAVTSAWDGQNPEERASDPFAGNTFLLEAAIAGQAEPRLRLE
ncbi:SMP-30/gluconolactonase/LRE family protein [Pseudomonas putida]|uniref:SMP-30/gluconolactonase/LRE family protein n=1 Tax=Pseudomonas putida TaxID=303 RepID=UPI00300F2EA5